VVLREILKIMSEEGPITTNDISQRLGVSEELVELAVQELLRRGFVEVVKAEWGDPCSSCIFKDLCSIKGVRGRGRAQYYMLTEKGWKLLNKRQLND
jgi:predicted ArsR family transcriptional regulator